MRQLRKSAILLVLAATVVLAAPDTAPLTERLVAAAIERIRHVVRYDPGYVRIAYPGGDVPANTGVCTDEIVRIYRSIGIDLQKEVHEDIVASPGAYHLQKPPDTNIDHRRVPNLAVFFRRHGVVLPITLNAKDYRPGDLITWGLGTGQQHIGIVVNRYDSFSGRPLIVHNIGEGPKMEDVLFAWRISGHFRYPR